LPLTESRANAITLLARAVEAVEKSHRVQYVPYARTFVRSLPPLPDFIPPTPPLARLIQGGRGGKVRLKLYLLLTLIATRYPYDIRNPPTPGTLARTLDLAPTTGPRCITSNMKWLTDHKFIALTKRPGKTPAIQLLNPHGTGDPLSDPRSPRPYVSIPLGFWSEGWLLQLSPVAIAVLFSLRERLGGYEQPQYLFPDRRESYGLSHDTWTRGSRELEDIGLLTASTIIQGEEFTYTRRRKSYWLNIDLLDTPVPNSAIPPAQTGADILADPRFRGNVADSVPGEGESQPPVRIKN
jgi:hypothetical protein